MILKTPDRHSFGGLILSWENFMNYANVPIDTQLAFVLPGWLILGLFSFSVVACIAFACATRKYVREIKENFPRLNIKINVILFGLMFLAWFAQIATYVELAVRGHVGIGWLHFFAAKYFIARSIVLNYSEQGYIHKTILIYAIVYIILYACGFILGGLLW